MKDYHINVYYSEEYDCYVAEIPDLEHCVVYGDSQEAVMRDVLIAKQAWREAARQKGIEMPAPTYRPNAVVCLLYR
jgi:predicted RNase H-like HicB family nuclease